MEDSRANIELLEKNKPRQERAKRTYQAILNASAELLVEVGVERISTNIMAERAGITVPALYRYFPNKYAVLYALGAALMDRQNAVFEKWFEENLDPQDAAGLLSSIESLLRATVRVTREQTGGIEIMQALRAVAPLQELRLRSHRMMSDGFHAVITELYPLLPSERSAIRARTTVDVGYSVVEMVLEDTTLNEDAVLAEGTAMIQQYWAEILREGEEAARASEAG